MKIATVLNVHTPSSVIIDTLESISLYMTDKILLVVDGVGWDKFHGCDYPVSKIKGFRHGVPRSPYRNVALGLMTAVEEWPDADWYCYCEYDVLFGSSRFRKNLEMADERDVWMLGSDGRVDDKAMPLVESLIGESLSGCYYMIGCCQFFSKKFIQKLGEINFFERFLNMTNNFSAGQFPSYTGYDISEHLYPSLARHFGGNLGVFATWDGAKWHGAGNYYPVRWKPDLEEDADRYSQASILHPIKDYDHPVREYHREKRKECNMAHALELS